MLIGGQAVLLHGRPRLTDDIDITLGVGPSELSTVQTVCAPCGLVPLPEDVDAFVRETFVLPCHHPPSGLRVDFIFSTTPYEAQAIGRAVIVKLAGTSVPFASAEDLILHKLFAGRPRDWEDAVGVVPRMSAMWTASPLLPAVGRLSTWPHDGSTDVLNWPTGHVDNPAGERYAGQLPGVSVGATGDLAVGSGAPS